MNYSDMKRLSAILLEAAPGVLVFRCPACKRGHQVWIGSGPGPRWEFNGNFDRPTFTPSLRISWERPSGKDVCHSHITDGQIQFLGDCTHFLAGKTVPIPVWDFSSAIRVCPERDIECGEYPENWCADCPKRGEK